MDKQDLALDNHQWLLCHKTKPSQAIFESLNLIPLNDRINVKDLELYPKKP